MMNERTIDLATQSGLDDWWSSDPASREDLVAVFDRFATLVAQDCIAMIQLHMPRNGVRSPENLQSKIHINNIADAYGIALPLPPSAYESQIANIMAGADAMAGDGGYQEASLKSPQFLESQARYNALFARTKDERKD